MTVVLECPSPPLHPDTIASSEISLEDLEQHRRELTGYCYRMLGSFFEADDAVHETMVRAWRGLGGFEGRSAVRSWLYRIATNVCLDLLRGRHRRALAMDLGPASSADSFTSATRPGEAWMEPIPDARVLAEDGHPADVAAARESIRLAFVAALQVLPARQRAVLILCDVLRWHATAVAELLETTVASGNSALQRARATLAERSIDGATSSTAVDAGQQELLDRYVDAFERYDIASLVTLLHEDAVMSMPPYDFWLRGPVEMGRWFLGKGIGCQGSRLLATAANGCAAFASYRPDPEGGYFAWAIEVIEVSGDRIVGHHSSSTPTSSPPSGSPTTSQATSPPISRPTTSPSPTKSSSCDSSVLAFRSRIEQPTRRAASCHRANASTTARSSPPVVASGQFATSAPSRTSTTVAWMVARSTLL